MIVIYRLVDNKVVHIDERGRTFSNLDLSMFGLVEDPPCPDGFDWCPADDNIGFTKIFDQVSGEVRNASIAETVFFVDNSVVL